MIPGWNFINKNINSGSISQFKLSLTKNLININSNCGLLSFEKT